MMDRRKILQYRLQNQLLSGTSFTTVEETVQWMGAIQGQDYNRGLWAIRLRTPNVERKDIIQSLTELKIVRSWTMRHTIHFVPLEDLQWMVELTKTRMLKRYKNHMLKVVRLGDSELNHSLESIQRILEGKKLLSRPKLRQKLEEVGIDTSQQKYYHILWYAAQHGLIFIGPMQGKQQSIGLVAEWSPKAQKLTQKEALQKLTGRYLQSHGPATIKDFSWWSGLTQKEAKLGFEMVESQCFTEDKTGVDYWYLTNEVLNNNTTSNTIHLIYSLDEFLIGYKDRTAIWSDSMQAKLNPKRTGFIFPILFNGEVIGSWKPEVNKSLLTMNFLLATTMEIPLDLLNKEAEKYSAFFDLELIDVKFQRVK